MKHTNFFRSVYLSLLCFVLLFIFSACSQNDGALEITDIPIDNNQLTTMVFGEYQFVVNSNNTVTITKYTGEGRDIEIPAKINEKKVTAIGNSSTGIGAFQDCTTLVSVIIPDGVTEIQDNAFYGCTNLKTVNIPNSVIFLGNNAFYNCGRLHSVFFEGNAPKVANDVFGPVLGSESNLTIYSRNNTEGWSDIWNGCYTSTYHKYLESGDYYYEINDDGTATITKYIGRDEEVVIPTEINGIKVTSIGNGVEPGAFQDCITIVSVIIPDGVTYIQDNAFRDCINLRTVKIPDSVTVIYHCAFELCPNLEAIYFEGDAPQTGNYLFDSRARLTIYYREGSDGWTNTWYSHPTATY